MNIANSFNFNQSIEFWKELVYSNTGSTDSCLCEDLNEQPMAISCSNYCYYNLNVPKKAKNAIQQFCTVSSQKPTEMLLM